MDLIVNGTATVRSSLGARRYYQGVMEQLAWPGKVEVTALPRYARLERASELMQRGRRGAIFWSPSQRGPLVAHHHVVTVLDCINVEHTYRGDWRLPLFRRLFNVVLTHAQAVVTISHATRDAVLRNYKVDAAKLIAIPGPIDFSNGVGGLSASVSDEPTSAPGIDAQPPFVLMITNALPHKNTAEAGRAFAASSAAPRHVTLRVIGSLAEPALTACRAAGVQVELHKGIDDATLVRWLRQCAFLFAPSLDEGLNLPIAEALSHGANVLCSDIPVHREFYEGEVLWCDPWHRDSMIAALDHALDRRGRWALPGPVHPRRSFDDVASDYRALFMRIAADSR